MLAPLRHKPLEDKHFSHLPPSLQLEKCCTFLPPSLLSEDKLLNAFPGTSYCTKPNTQVGSERTLPALVNSGIYWGTSIKQLITQLSSDFYMLPRAIKEEHGGSALW